MAIAAAEPSPAAVMTWARGLAALPATHTPGTLVRPVPSATTQPLSSVAQPRSVSRSSFGTNAGPHEHGGAAYDVSGLELDTGEPVVLDDEAGDGLLDDADGAGDQPLALVRRERGRRG